jgi:NADPH:quinone reductase-like Zn-dependent oxidoreductase
MPPVLPKTQIAVQINHVGGPEVLEINRAAPVPTAGENQLLVKNTFSGVNFVDIVNTSPPSSFLSLLSSLL